jgi:hypothetical protein
MNAAIGAAPAGGRRWNGNIRPARVPEFRLQRGARGRASRARRADGVGFAFQLVNEQYHRSMMFAASNQPAAATRPRLTPDL